MLNSMTGFGEAHSELDGVSYAVEIKALNSRYFKTNIKAPDQAAFLEEAIEKLLRKSLGRGTVQYVLRVKETSATSLFEIDEPALRAVVDRLGEIGASANVTGNLDIGNLLSLPGMVRPLMPDADAAERMHSKVMAITGEAIEKLKAMRAAEGQHLEADLRSHCSGIAQDLEVVRQRGGTVIKDYAKRLKNRVDELLAEAKLSLDEETLAREVAVLADRSDISEELARLDSHLQQFDDICREGGQAGRRLDFICQEMLREANTIASKATDAEIIRRMVDVKCRIDRIKEQVQNVE